MSKYEDILTGTSVPLLEVDDEDTNPEYNEISGAEVNADIVDIVDHLGTEDFQFLYLNLYTEIRTIPEEKQKELCTQLMDEFSKIYSFEFTPILTFDSSEDVEHFLKFIEFIEFDNIEFLSKLISGLNYDLLRKNTELFIESNWIQIEQKINNLTENGKNLELISNFFRTNNKNGIIDFLRTRLERNKMLVILKSMEGESNNE
jgi:hypothetical protein